jgi:hypothetical protein
MYSVISSETLILFPMPEEFLVYHVPCSCLGDLLLKVHILPLAPDPNKYCVLFIWTGDIRTHMKMWDMLDECPFMGQWNMILVSEECQHSATGHGLFYHQSLRTPVRGKGFDVESGHTRRSHLGQSHTNLLRLLILV